MGGGVKMSILLNLRIVDNEVVDYSGMSSGLTISQYNTSQPINFSNSIFANHQCFDFGLYSRLCISNIVLRFSNDFTIAYWIKSKIENRWNTSTYNSGANDGDWCVFMGVPFYSTLYMQGAISYEKYNNGDIGSSIGIARGKCNDTNWHHLAMCRKEGTVNVYIDGVKKLSTSNSNDLYINTSTSQIIQVGGCDWNRNYGFDGYMDDIVIADHCIFDNDFTIPKTYLLSPIYNLYTTNNIYGIL